MIDIKENVSLAPFTTFKVGGNADFFVVAKSNDEIREAVLFAKERGLPVRVLGGGSNVLVSDEGVRGLVIKNEISGIAYHEEDSLVHATVGAGVWWDDFVIDTVAKGYWGLENLSAIPGTVGATPVQNVGAYGVEVGELISEVQAYDTERDRFVTFSKVDCQFDYRDSFFKSTEGRRYFIVSVTYVLSKEANPKLSYQDLVTRFENVSSKPSLSEIRDAVIDIRSKKFPDLRILGTAGSFFKNPIITKEAAAELLSKYPSLPVFPFGDNLMKVSLGFILDKICGLRGYRVGDVGLFDRQALVLVNYGNASENDIKNFAEEIADKVFEKTKIKIEWEPAHL